MADRVAPPSASRGWGRCPHEKNLRFFPLPRDIFSKKKGRA